MHYHFHKQLEKVRNKFLTLGSLVEDRVRKACQGFLERDMAVLDMVIRSDYEIDEMEIEIEEDCLKILALYQPVASDLRFIVALIKINSEIERIGDYAVKIAMRAKFIAEHSSLIFPMDYTPMAEQVIAMLKMSLDALVDMDGRLAHQIFILDDEIDEMRNRAYDVIKDALKTPTEHPGCLLNGYLMARHLERIADRATNIAEEVIYMVDGQIVRGEHN